MRFILVEGTASAGSEGEGFSRAIPFLPCWLMRQTRAAPDGWWACGTSLRAAAVAYRGTARVAFPSGLSTKSGVHAAAHRSKELHRGSAVVFGSERCVCDSCGSMEP